ncbi:BTAD domain-containing putative transcriptional regulator [Streptomyces sp. NPDC006207]
MGLLGSLSVSVDGCSGRGLARPPHPFPARLPAHPPRPLAAPGDAHGRLLAGLGPRGGAQQPRRRDAPTAPDAGYRDRRTRGRLPLRCLPAGSRARPLAGLRRVRPAAAHRPGGGGPGDRTGAAEEYERALALYRGEFLAESPYEEWTVLHRERLRLAHLDALARLSELHFTAGRYAPCAELCRRLVALDPCRETAHRRLMRCLSRIGQPHLAILQFRACVRTLREELGVPPQRETVELHQRLRDDLPV